MNSPSNELMSMLSEYLSLDQLSCYSLPPEAYTDLDLHALELDAIFRKEWLCVGRAEYIPAPGDYYCIDTVSYTHLTLPTICSV